MPEVRPKPFGFEFYLRAVAVALHGKGQPNARGKAKTLGFEFYLRAVAVALHGKGQLNACGIRFLAFGYTRL
ncbi:MAG: hypothetical protein FWG43_04510 [Clostridiales bacterium]|nr:hypothetical protein [Clostridiales bacterium]